MTDPTDENPNPENGGEEPATHSNPVPESEEETASSPPPPSDPLQELRDFAMGAFQNGANDAREALENQLPGIRDDVSRGFNDASYAIGYAVSFGAAMIREFSPDNVTAGFDQGAEAGERAANEVVTHRRNRETNPEEAEAGTPEPEEAEPSAP